MTLVLRINSSNPEKEKIRRAAEIIKDGGVVVFPTETVYGIGANALNSTACRKIFKIKGRAMDNPLIVHVSSMNMAADIGHIPKRYSKTIEKIWPGPFTIVVKAKKSVPSVVTAGLDTVSIRMPDSKIALGLIRESGVPIAAPSANISKRPSSTRAAHAKKYFYGKADAIIDSKPSKFGIESTILDLNSFTLLRPGAFTTEQIERLFKRTVKVTQESRGISKTHSKPLSPGMKYTHYSPITPIFMFDGSATELKRMTLGLKVDFVFIGSSESCKIMKECAKRVIILGKRSKKISIASNLFHALILLDEIKPRFAIVESFSEEGLGLAIMNRLRKACGNKYFNDKNGLYRLLKGF